MNTDLIKRLYQHEKYYGSGADMSDGYHSMSELYFTRAVLFARICKDHKDKSWKSKQHSDGTMYEGYFIVGISTPAGQYTYHYPHNTWDLFEVNELDKAPAYDGHKPEDIGRLLLEL